MSEHYVELIKYFVLVNVPTFVYALWYTTRPLLPERTKEKVLWLVSWLRKINLKLSKKGNGHLSAYHQA